MNDKSISWNKLVTAVGWSLVGMLVVAVWSTWAAGHSDLALVLGSCLVPACTLAGVSQIRRGQIRQCALLRAVAGIDSDKGGGADLHSVR